MIQRRVHLLYVVVDILLISASFYLPCTLNPALIAPLPPAARLYTSVFVFWAITMILLLSYQNLYTTDRTLSIPKEWGLVIKSVLYSAILAAVFIFILKILIFSRTIFIESAFLAALLLSVWRTAKRTYVRYLIRKGHLDHRILVIGAGKMGSLLASQIQNNPSLGKKIIGFLDDTKTSSIGPFKIIGKIADLEETIRKHFVDEIYITIPSERAITAGIILRAVKLGRTVKVVAEHFNLPFREFKWEYIGFLPLITYYEKGLYGTGQSLKRFLDVVAAGLTLILLSPLLAFIAFLIKLDSDGPVFYVSQRCGRRGRIFNFYKFRSMINNADQYKDALREKSDVRSPIFKMKDDPRITRVGAILRKYSLDELPQLINVLKGDMSLVGPRPFPVDESTKLEDKYMPRLNIKPGMTGLAQIKGRSNLSFYQWAKWDLWYLDNWSFGLDLFILLWTLPAVLKKKGAY